MKKLILEFYQADVKSLKSFGLIMGAFLPIVFGLIIPFIFNYPLPLIPWIIAIPFLLLAILKPEILKFIYTPWMLFGHVLGIINTSILLGIVYYMIFTPVAIVLRLRKKDPLKLKFEKAAQSYRVINRYGDTSKRMDRPF